MRNLRKTRGRGHATNHIANPQRLAYKVDIESMRDTLNSRIKGLATLTAASFCLLAPAQDLPLTQAMSMSKVSPLDPTRNLTNPVLQSTLHTPLPEEYIWTADDTARDAKIVYTFPARTEQIEPHYFRTHFNVPTLPKEATLYIAGPRSVKVWINGQLAEQVESDVTSPLGMHVFATPSPNILHAGKNTIAIEAVRGRGVTGFANSALLRQQTFGQVLVAKIVPRAEGINGPALLLSNKDWRSSTTAAKGWEQADFDDAEWKPVQSIGGIESSLELFQWNADAGLYDWPGYDGISGYLAHPPVPVSGILPPTQAADPLTISTP